MKAFERIAILKELKFYIQHVNINSVLSISEMTLQKLKSNASRVQIILALNLILCNSIPAYSCDTPNNVKAPTHDAQMAALESNTAGMGFGPQSPRDLSLKNGSYKRVFNPAPSSTRKIVDSKRHDCLSDHFTATG